MNENNDKKKLTETDRRNWLQEIFHELRGIKLDAHAFRFYKLGYVMSSFIEDNVSDKDKLSNRYSDPYDSFSYLTRILSEWEPIKDDEEFDLNELLESLKAELGEEDPPSELVSEEELDEFISKLEQETPPPKAVPPPDVRPGMEEYIKVNKKRFEDTYTEVCNFIIKNYDKELSQVDDFDEEGNWKYADKREVERQKQQLNIVIRSAADKKTRELLKNDMWDLRCFHRWLRDFNDNQGTQGTDWFAPVE